MCFWNSSKSDSGDAPQVSAPPTPSPAPTMRDPTPQVSAGAQRKKVQALQYGMLSTFKTAGGAAGITGTGGDLLNQNASGKKTLGS